jgi:dTDP-4-dehydrorhamnose reductase
MTPLELWAGVECTVNRVGDHLFDQLERSGHARRADDIERFAELGVTALRYPVLWERLAPHRPDAIDWQWSDERLARIKAAGMVPIVGLLHHGSGPAYTSLLDERFPHLFAHYARQVAERYPWVDQWTPINEPLTTARFSGLYGHWYPHCRDDGAFVRALLNQLRGIALAMREIRAVNRDARLVQTEDLGRPSGTTRLRGQIEHERQRRWLTWDLLCGQVDSRHPLHAFLLRAGASEQDFAFFLEHPTPPDTVGINYYLTSDRWLDHRLDLYPSSSHGSNGLMAYADVEAVRADPGGLAGHEQQLCETWERYRLPVALTEVHLGCTREEQMRWLAEAWQGAGRARERGAEVRAVTAWALLGSHDWNSLVTRDAGQYEPGLYDIRAPEPRPTALAAVAKDLAAGRAPGHPVVHMSGWWRRPVRLWFAPATGSEALLHAFSGPPILIVGMRGTLGRAFERICERRGLPVHVVGRTDMDISEPSQVDAVLRRVNPWAVINAAGYVRVDAAETDREGCWRDNVTGAVNLAAACRRRGLPLVTFSSDLVFDGSIGRPYTEADTPVPLNVYGTTKAEAERRVLELLPEALVIRTSAFFGPWDEHNFPTVLLRSLGDGTPFCAPGESIVSPTYVPDLVNATLDLLIDGEHGIWHLANQGEVTWHEFGRLVARAAGMSDDLVQPCSWREIWQPAVRPPYSALGSVRGSLMPSLDQGIKAFAVEIAATESEETPRCVSW